jgi:hypothetical protein
MYYAKPCETDASVVLISLLLATLQSPKRDCSGASC